ncbi:Candidapepsin-3 [Cytospora mali]|uniref:Candidapepsin-3 n=1 Tax=Cytospora mali TaxID=578113 RepID=A0A194VLI3_CYTMA|nr:Candidapepsin-3 [Valsa mali]
MPSMASSLMIQLVLLAISFLPRAWAYCAEDEPCVHMQVAHSTNRNIFSKRAVEVQLANRSDVAYYAQLNIGTPAQQVYVQLDTGSFELWVNPTCSNLDSADEQFCNMVGSYNASQSSTASDMDSKKTLSYGIGSANISYFQDDIALPGASTPMTGVQFGVATSTKSEFSGILGIGYGLGYTTKYRNFVDELAYQNHTKVKAYSVALGSKDEGEGVLVFGGVDTSKFAGNLAALPIIPAKDSPDGVARYWISMNNMSLTPPSGQTKMYLNSTMDVFLDTGSTLTLLPQDVCDQLGSDFGASGVDSSGYYNVDCSLADLDGTVNFDFNGVSIEVPYSEFIRKNSEDSCVLGITPSDTFTLLGDTFMRSAYAVFDLDTNAIHMQQYTNCGSTPAAIANTSILTTLEGECKPAHAASKVAGLALTSSASASASTTKTSSIVTSTLSPSATTAVTVPAAASGAEWSPSSSASSSSDSSSSSAASSVRRSSPAALAVALVVLLTLT